MCVSRDMLSGSVAEVVGGFHTDLYKEERLMTSEGIADCSAI